MKLLYNDRELDLSKFCGGKEEFEICELEKFVEKITKNTYSDIEQVCQEWS